MSKLNSLITALVLAFAPTAIVGCASTGDDMTDVDDADSTAAGKFDVWQASDGQFHFHLKSGNGSILLTSEAYTSRTGAINGVLSTLNNGVDTAQYAAIQASNGGYLLHLKAANGETISFSQVYSTKSNATRAINSCVHAVTTYLDKLEANTSGARVSVEQGTTGAFRFSVFASNGQQVLSSESYTTAAAAWNGAFAVQDAAGDKANFAVKTASDGRYYFTLSALNGQVVGVSQMYTTSTAALKGETSVAATVKGIDIL
jgi:uncharacterized protein YegP (UPF0339 family)